MIFAYRLVLRRGRGYRYAMTVSQTGAEAIAQSPIIATPTKDATGENFPVGSWLLPRHLRRHVAAY